jgi:hypothetical protein
VAGAGPTIWQSGGNRLVLDAGDQLDLAASLAVPSSSPPVVVRVLLSCPDMYELSRSKDVDRDPRFGLLPRARHHQDQRDLAIVPCNYWLRLGASLRALNGVVAGALIAASRR